MTKKAPMSFAAMMAFWPTLAQLAADLGCPPNTVLTWSRRGAIPRGQWGSIVEAAQKRHYRITATMLEAADKLPRDCSARVEITRSTRPARQGPHPAAPDPQQGNSEG